MITKMKIKIIAIIKEKNGAANEEEKIEEKKSD
jgi:hypothetical protein